MTDTDALTNVIDQAAANTTFRAQLIDDPDGALSRLGVVLSTDERTVLDEYRRVVAQMSEAEISEAIRNYYSKGRDGLRGAA